MLNMRRDKDSAWIEWVARNLAQGVPQQRLIDAMIEGGFEKKAAAALLEDITESPVFAAAKRIGAEVRKWTSLADALLELQQLSYGFIDIPRVRGISGEEFLHQYYARNLPVIIEGFAADWPAIGKWTPGYFAEHFGDESVTFQRGRGNGDHRHSFIDHSETAPFRDYLDLISNDDETNDYYLIAHDRLLDRQPFAPLFDDICFDEDFLDPVAPVGRVFFWLGPKGATTPLHRDLGNVYLVQIDGRKEITMIPSLQMHKVYNETGYHSDVDFENLDIEKFPLLDSAFVMREIISPGEMLFIPMGWWHHVKAVEKSITITGNNFRFPNAFTSIF